LNFIGSGVKNEKVETTVEFLAALVNFLAGLVMDNLDF